MRRILASVSLIGVFCVTTPAMAGVVYDHLECFKMRDYMKPYNAIVDLNPAFNSPGIELQKDCRLTVKSQEICFPVVKTVIQSDQQVIPVVGQNLQNGFLCYTVRCPFEGVPDFPVADQFGERTVGRLKSSRLCVPADW